MSSWVRVAVATVVPLVSGALAWWACVAAGLDLDTAGIVVGLVVLLPATPLAIWAGRSDAHAHEPGSGRGAEGEGAGRRVPKVIGDVPREPRAFQPRPGLRRRVEEIAAEDAATVVCALVGARGVGKTQLAAAYCRYRAAWDVPLAWLNAESLEQLHGSLDLMATELGLRAETDDRASVARKVRTWLEERREPYLVVFDNATDADVLAPILPARGPSLVWTITAAQDRDRLHRIVNGRVRDAADRPT